MLLEKKMIQATSPQEIAKIFVLCMKIRLESLSFTHKVEELRRLGINTEIAALHSRTSGQTISVIVQEVGMLAEKIRGVLSELADRGTELATIAMKSTAGCQISQKYYEAWEKGIQGASRDLVLTQQVVQLEKMQSLFRNLSEQFRYHEMELTKLERLAIHIPMITLLMKINASAERTEEGKNKFQNMAESIDQFSAYVREKTEEIINNINEGIDILTKASE